MGVTINFSWRNKVVGSTIKLCESEYMEDPETGATSSGMGKMY